MARHIILAQSECTAAALCAWVELLGHDAPAKGEPSRIVFVNPTGVDESGVRAYEQLTKKIESMHIEYALDHDRDGAPDAMSRCKAGVDSCSMSDWQDVVGVQIHLLARSLTPTPGHVDRKTYDMGLAGTLPAYGDGYRRHRFSAMVAAYNRSGPRER